MSNPLFNALGGNQDADFVSQFQNFMKQMQGKDPNQEIANLLKSGRITQQELNQAQQVAQQFLWMFKK